MMYILIIKVCKNMAKIFIFPFVFSSVFFLFTTSWPQCVFVSFTFNSTLLLFLLSASLSHTHWVCVCLQGGLQLGTVLKYICIFCHWVRTECIIPLKAKGWQTVWQPQLKLMPFIDSFFLARVVLAIVQVYQRSTRSPGKLNVAAFSIFTKLQQC